MQPANLERFNELVGQLGQLVFAHVTDKIAARKWKCARFSDRNNFSKLRIELLDGAIDKSMKTPTDGEFFDLLDEVWAIKDEVFSEKWYGLTIEVDPAGKCEVAFDYNEDDPKFFDY